MTRTPSPDPWEPIDKALGITRHAADTSETREAAHPDEVTGWDAIDVHLDAIFRGEVRESRDYVNVPGECRMVRAGSPAHHELLERDHRRPQPSAVASTPTAIREDRSRPQRGRTVEVREVTGWVPR